MGVCQSVAYVMSHLPPPSGARHTLLPAQDTQPTFVQSFECVSEFQSQWLFLRTYLSRIVSNFLTNLFQRAFFATTPA